MTGQAVWRRACPAGQALDLLHARVAEPYAPHVHEEYAVGACTAGREVIRYRGTLHYAGPGSVVVLEPGEAHTGGPADPPDFTYRVMYPAAGLLAEAGGGEQLCIAESEAVAATMRRREDYERIAAVLPGSVSTEFSDSHRGRESSWMLAPDDVARAVSDLVRYPERAIPSRLDLRPSKPPTPAPRACASTRATSAPSNESAK